MSETDHLGLPFILASQAQKHVTHNEALLKLDALVHLSVLSRSIAAPPGSQAAGDRYLVDASATGDWAGHEGEIAAFQDGAWSFFPPVAGWRAWIADEDAFLLFDGTDWVNPAAQGDLHNVPMLGVRTTADATNRLSVRSNAVLFTSLDAAAGGNGDAQVKVDKEAAGDTASLLFQTGASGRAEVGLTGDDDFHFKVSPDGSAWADAIVVDKDDGQVRVLAGTAAAPSLALVDAGNGFSRPGANQVSLSHGGVESVLFSTGNVRIRSDASLGITMERYIGSGGAPSIDFRKARGSLASSSDVQTNDFIGQYVFRAWGGGAFRVGGQIDAIVIEPAPGAAAMGTRLDFRCSPLGSVTATEVARLEFDTGLSMYGGNPVVDQNRLHVNRTATLGTLHAGAAGKQQYATDLGGGAGLLVHDGTRWKRAGNGGQATVSSDAALTLTTLSDAENIRHTGTLTANRAVTLSTTNASGGARFRITRTGAGAFTLDVGTGPLKSLATNTWAEFVYDGSAWYLSAYGAL